MGVVSNGMLCSGDELRLTGDADGILILPADTLRVALADLYGDVVLDVDVKPNRGDALCLVGLAREVAAATGAPARFPEIRLVEADGPATPDRLVVAVDDPGLCPRFVGRWVSDVRIGTSPDAVQMRLLRPGCGRSATSSMPRTTRCWSSASRPTPSTARRSPGRDGAGRAGLRVRLASPPSASRRSTTSTASWLPTPC